MRQIIKTTPLSLCVMILGAAIIIAGILIMALRHDMSWQSYVIIGVLMLCSLWAMANIPTSLYMLKEKVRNNTPDELE